MSGLALLAASNLYNPKGNFSHWINWYGTAKPTQVRSHVGEHTLPTASSQRAHRKTVAKWARISPLKVANIINKCVWISH